MFYRQKILLSLVEIFGGKLSNTDLEKLLFLFCRTTQQNHYDFFPYKYGPFSFMSYYDKRKLTERGQLKDKEYFELNTSTSYLNKLKPKDRISLRSFFMHTFSLRGEALVRKVYLEYPRYIVKSKIVKNILTQEEYARASSSWNLETENTLFTIGYEGITIDQYLCQLLFNNINALVDIRKNPFSRKHGFSQSQLEKYMAKVGIEYYHLPELGISSNLRKGLNGRHSYEILFEYYASTILPEQGQAINEIKKLLSEHRRIALTCFEAEYNMCHRYKVAELLDSDPNLNISVHHI
ncbi:MAG: DUF488 domain-containing protein [Chloroflexi bacterium]|nr:DUF488 domain-containing protein [Chloroflexota bacterium]